MSSENDAVEQVILPMLLDNLRSSREQIANDVPVLLQVEVRRVAEVSVRPELKEHPAEVVLQFQTPYKLEIPADSVVRLAREGILGLIPLNRLNRG